MTGIRKRSISIQGHRTSVSLEPDFWDALERFAAEDGRSLASLVAEVDRERLAGTNGDDPAQAAEPSQNLSSALRVYAFRRASRTPD